MSKSATKTKEPATSVEDAFVATADPKAAAKGKATAKAGAADEGEDLLATKAGAEVPTGAALLKIKRHPLSEKYGPPLLKEELEGLADDIEANGQHETIKLWEGMVLAGWNRYQACLSKNIEPRVENYQGDKPEAVAFGTNVIRRRLSSISKAFMGAKFYLSKDGYRQQDIAKQCSVSLNRLNQCIQLLRLDTPEGKAAQETLSTNPEVTPSNFDEMLLECGIARSTSKPTTPTAPVKNGVGMDGDDNIDDLDLDSDLTGGAIDNLIDDDEDADGEGDDAPTKPKARREIGEGAAPLPSTGSKAGSAMTRPEETPVSKLARHFKSSLTAEEQAKFVAFVWPKLKVALDTAIRSGAVSYELPADKPDNKKAKGSEYKKEVAAKTPAKPAKPVTPAQQAARDKFAAQAKAKADAKKQGATGAPAADEGGKPAKGNGHPAKPASKAPAAPAKPARPAAKVASKAAAKVAKK